MVAGGSQVGTDEALAGGGADAASAAADLHLELDHALGLFGGIAGERHGEVGREAPHLGSSSLQAAGQGVAGMPAAGPVSVGVGGDTPGHGGVAAGAQGAGELAVQGGVAVGAGLGHGGPGVGKCADDRLGPAALDAGAVLIHVADAAQCPDQVGAAQLDRGQMLVVLGVGGIVVTDQRAAVAGQEAEGVQLGVTAPGGGPEPHQLAGRAV